MKSKLEHVQKKKENGKNEKKSEVFTFGKIEWYLTGHKFIVTACQTDQKGCGCCLIPK